MYKQITICLVAIDVDDTTFYLDRALLSVVSIYKYIDSKIKITVYTNNTNKFSHKLVQIYKKELNRISPLLNIVDISDFGDFIAPKQIKIKGIIDTLENSKDESITVFIDVDLICIGNWHKTLQKLLYQSKVDIMACIELNSLEVSSYPNINSGFVIIKKNTINTKIVNRWLESFEFCIKNSINPRLEHDQPHFRRALSEFMPNLICLPKEYNFRGHEAQIFTDWAWGDVFGVHNNLIFSQFSELLMDSKIGAKNSKFFIEKKIDELEFFCNKKSKKINTPRLINFYFFKKNIFISTVVFLVSIARHIFRRLR
jgi:hypothetical protein